MKWIFKGLLCLVMVMPFLGQMTPATVPAAGAAGSADDATLAEVAALRDGLVEAMGRGDVDKVLAYLHPEVVVTWANAEVSHGPEGVRAYYKKMMDGPNKIVESLTIKPNIEGRKMYGPNVLISYGSLGDHYKLTDGSDFVMNARFSSLLVKENGRWLIKGFHSSGNLFDNPVMWIAVKRTTMWVGIAAGAAGALAGFIVAKMLGGRKASA